MSHLAGPSPLNFPPLLSVLIVERNTNHASPPLQAWGGRPTGGHQMFDRMAQWQPDQGAAAATRAVSALALAALAVIHVVDLPGTLGPTPLVGIGYLGIIVASV